MRAADSTVAEYRHSRSLQIVACAVCGIIIAVFGWMLLGSILPRLNEPELRRTAWLTVPIALFVLIFTIIATLNTLKGRVVVDSRTISSISAFSTISFTLEDIRGYRLTEKQLMFLESHSGKRIRISAYFERGAELQAWIRQRFPDIDAASAEAELEGLSYDTRYGLSAADRAARMALAKRVAIALNVCGVLCAAWQVYGKPYLPALIAALVVPPLIVIGAAAFRGLIHVDLRKDSKLPTVFSGLFLSSCVLPLRSFTDYHVLDHSNTWLPLLTLTAGLLVVLRLNIAGFVRGDRNSILHLIGTVFILGMYSYGALITSNCYFDRSHPVQSTAVVEDKWVDSGKWKSYHVKLAAFGAHPAGIRMQIRLPQ